MKIFFTFCLVAAATILHAQDAVNRLVIQFYTDPCAGVVQGETPHTGNAQCDNAIAANGGTHVVKHRAGKSTGAFFFTVEFASASQLKNVLASCMNNSMVKFAEADVNGNGGGTQMTVPNDQHYGNQWGLKNNGTFSPGPAVTGADIDMENAWSVTTGSATTVVGTIDSGLKLDHPEVSGRLWINAGEIPANGTDDDANGYVDDINGWDFANVDNNPTDDQGHGTNVTGIIAATGNNTIGYAGVDWNCRLMTLKGIDANNSGWYSWWADALYYAVDNGVDVINMSVGGSGTSTLLQNAINYALSNNVTICACMMNTNNNVAYYPAAFPGVIAVGATNADDTRSAPFFWSGTSGSNYGSHISVVAPGNYIYGLSYTSNTNYGTYWGGTSQATPLVAGVAALLVGIDPSLTPAQIKVIIEQSAEDQVGLTSEDVAGWDQYYGHGRLNAFAAVQSTRISSSAAYGTVSLYPSPANDVVTFSAGGEAMDAFSVVDVQGRTVISESLNGATTHTLNCEMLRPGIYFLRMETAEEVRIIRFIVSH
jgi:subtilisin family serine protease